MNIGRSQRLPRAPHDILNVGIGATLIKNTLFCDNGLGWPGWATGPAVLGSAGQAGCGLGWLALLDWLGCSAGLGWVELAGLTGQGWLGWVGLGYQKYRILRSVLRLGTQKCRVLRQLNIA